MPIRLTPLIDVVFILLLFFMLSSRMESMGLLQLETHPPQSAGESDDPPAELYISEDGLEWNGAPVDTGDIRERLAQYDGDIVMLATSRSVALAEFTRWLGAIKDAGLEPAWNRDQQGDGKTP